MTFFICTKDFTEEFRDKIRRCEKIVSPGIINQSSKNHSLLGRVLLSYIMSEKGFDKKLQFTYGENGKPYLKNSSTFFNISHSGNYVVCSVSESEIGCDVQTVEKYNPRIAERFFTESEKLFLQKSENPSEDFTRLWAMKESVLKKTGEGITGGLNTFSFENCLAESRFVKFGYHFKVCRFPDAYVCVCSDTEENELIEIKKEEIENYTDSVLKGEL